MGEVVVGGDLEGEEVGDWVVVLVMIRKMNVSVNGVVRFVVVMVSLVSCVEI